MANNSTISIGFKLEDASGGFKKLIMDAESFRKAMGAAVVETEKLKKPFVNFASLATGLDSFNSTLNNLQSTVKSLTDAYQIQKVAETQLETVMRQRMCATEEEISSIKALASEQQKLGVIGDEVQLSGAQQMATFLKEKSSIDVLLPAMNNLLAQQKGLNATNQDAVSVGNLMGKAMQGQTSALTRVGITFDASQEKIMKFGNESQRAAMLAEIITQNVGNMNTELAKTDSGKQKQLENDLGDLKETAGSLLQGIQPYLTFAASATTALTGVIKLYNGVKIIGLIMLSFGSKTLSVCKILTVSFQGSLKQTRRAFQLYNAAAKGGAAASLAFKVALRGALIATGVGIAIAAVTGIIAYFALRTDEATAATNKLLDAEARAKREAENLEQARQREESSIKASTAALELNIAKLKEFSGTKEQEQKLVSEMNNTYGSTIGYFSSVSDWYKALTANSEAYCRQMVIEARTRMLADQIAQKEQEKQDIIYDKNGNHKKYSTKKGKWVEDKTKILGYADTINPDGTISRGTQAIYGGKYEDSEWEKATAAVKKLNQEKEALAKQLEDAVKDAASIEFSIKGDSTPPTTPNTPTPTSDKQIPEGSKEYYKNQASDLNRKISLELDPTKKSELIRQLMEVDAILRGLEWQEHRIRLDYEFPDFEPLKPEDLAPGKIELTEYFGIEKLKKSLPEVKGQIKDTTDKVRDSGKEAAEKLQKNFEDTGANLGALSGLMGSLSGMTDESTATMMQWGEQLLSTAASVLPAIQAVTMALAAKSAAEVPVVGWINAIAAIAAIGSAFISLPKFADGGIVSGPTVGLIGEYAGASNNPEVVAPLDKLRGMLNPAGQPVIIGGTLKASGRDIVCVLANETRIASKSGRKTNIKL